MNMNISRLLEMKQKTFTLKKKILILTSKEHLSGFNAFQIKENEIHNFVILLINLYQIALC